MGSIIKYLVETSSNLFDGDYRIFYILSTFGLFFVIQMFLCFKLQGKWHGLLKIIPVLVLFPLLIWIILMAVGIFGDGYMIQAATAAAYLAVIFSPCFIGDALAWIVYGVSRTQKKKKSKTI